MIAGVDAGGQVVRAWTKGQARDFAKRIRQDVGDGWKFLVPQIQSAVVSAFVLDVVLGQQREQVAVAAVQTLLVEVRQVLGMDSGGAL